MSINFDVDMYKFVNINYNERILQMKTNIQFEIAFLPRLFLGLK
jgi:hypothetical protein